MDIQINSLEETKSLAEKIARLTTNGDVITLTGDLGSGKTTFCRFFINSLLDEEQDILSPTFNIVHPYDTDNFTIWHFDLYRLENAGEVEAVGLYDAFDNGVSIIEWPEIIDSILPPDRLLVKINTEGDKRTAKIKPFGNWKERL